MHDEEGTMRVKFSELAPWHANDTLSESDRAWIGEYVRTHPDAAAELEWHASLRRMAKQDAPEISSDLGLDRLLQRVRAEKHSVRQTPRREPVLPIFRPVREFALSLGLRPSYALAAAMLVLIQGGLIGALAIKQRNTDQQFAEYRTLATVPATGPLLRVSFKPDSTESDIRYALMDVGGIVVGGPGQLGEYLVRVPAERIDAAAATLRGHAAVEAVEVSPTPSPRP